MYANLHFNGRATSTGERIMYDATQPTSQARRRAIQDLLRVRQLLCRQETPGGKYSTGRHYRTTVQSTTARCHRCTARYCRVQNTVRERQNEERTQQVFHPTTVLYCVCQWCAVLYSTLVLVEEHFLLFACRSRRGLLVAAGRFFLLKLRITVSFFPALRSGSPRTRCSAVQYCTLKYSAVEYSSTVQCRRLMMPRRDRHANWRNENEQREHAASQN